MIIYNSYRRVVGNSRVWCQNIAEEKCDLWLDKALLSLYYIIDST